MADVRAYYYTDPACPWSWALEPARRKLVCALGDSLRWTYVMAGLARELRDPVPPALEALQAAHRSLMPVDARLYLEDLPSSSYPACIAVKAAAEQGDPGAYLRHVREHWHCRRRRLDASEALLDVARGVPGLDLERFRIDLASHGTLEAFGADLDRATEAAQRRREPGGPRHWLPRLEFVGADGERHGVDGFADYETLRAAAVAAGAQPIGDGPPSIEAALRRFGAMATVEVAAVCDLPGPRAPAELWRLAGEWRLRAERVGSGELWYPA
jgi:predicted DsbA family dithiol-disulfide isomerase